MGHLHQSRTSNVRQHSKCSAVRPSLLDDRAPGKAAVIPSSPQSASTAANYIRSPTDHQLANTACLVCCAVLAGDYFVPLPYAPSGSLFSHAALSPSVRRLYHEFVSSPHTGWATPPISSQPLHRYAF